MKVFGKTFLWLLAMLALCGRLHAAVTETNAAPQPLLPAVIPYSFQQTTFTETLDSSHAVIEHEAKVEEVFPIAGKILFRRLISEDGKPATPEQRAKQERKEALWRQTLEEGKQPKHHEQITDLTAGFTEEELERVFVMEEIGRETIRGRPCVLYRFNGRSGRVLHVGGHYQKFFDVVVDGITGRLWVDEVERKPARVEVRLKKPVSLAFGLLLYIKEFRLDAEFERLEAGIWWPRQADGIVDARYLVFKQFIMRGHVVNENFKPAKEPRTACVPRFEK